MFCFPVAFRQSAFPSWASCSRPGTQLPLRSAYPTTSLGGVDLDGVSAYHTHETRLGPGALCIPGTAVSTRLRHVLSRRLPPLNGRSLSSRYHNPSQDVVLTRHQQGFTGRSQGVSAPPA